MRSQLEPGDEIGGYRLEGLCGSGGMAVVYRARSIRLGRVVALKVLSAALAEDETFKARFVRESELAASVEHPNVVPVYEASTSGSRLFLAMRFVDGPDLRWLLQKQGVLPLPRALNILRQAARGLDAAHRAGLIHRDVKPGNLLIASRNGADHVYVTDFGLTRRRDAVTQFTRTGEFIGTTDYVAPEQISGGAVDARADVYGLGCVAYRTLTGVVPFERDSDIAVLYGHLLHQAPAVTSRRPDLPAAVDEVFAKVLAKRPEDRFPTCSAFVAALRVALVPSEQPRPPATGEAIPVGPHALPARRARRTSTETVAAALMALALAVVGVAFVTRGVAPKEPEFASRVSLPFAPEVYDGGIQVQRTWSLSGKNGEHVEGVLRVSARGRAVAVYEVLPGAMALRGSPDAVDATTSTDARVPGFRVSTSALATTVRYRMAVPPGTVSVERLQHWARAQARDAAQWRQRVGAPVPRTVTFIAVAPAHMQLRERGVPHRLVVKGRFSDGTTANATALSPARFESTDAAAFDVDANGVVTPLRAGESTVMVRLGPLSTIARVNVQPSRTG